MASPYGTLNNLPREVRDMIYASAMEANRTAFRYAKVAWQQTAAYPRLRYADRPPMPVRLPVLALCSKLLHRECVEAAVKHVRLHEASMTTKPVLNATPFTLKNTYLAEKLNITITITPRFENELGHNLPHFGLGGQLNTKLDYEQIAQVLSPFSNLTEAAVKIRSSDNDEDDEHTGGDQIWHVIYALEEVLEDSLPKLTRYSIIAAPAMLGIFKQKIDEDGVVCGDGSWEVCNGRGDWISKPEPEDEEWLEMLERLHAE